MARILQRLAGLGIMLMATEGWVLSALWGWRQGGWLSAIGAGGLALPFAVAIIGCGVTLIERTRVHTPYLSL